MQTQPSTPTFRGKDRLITNSGWTEREPDRQACCESEQQRTCIHAYLSGE